MASRSTGIATLAATAANNADAGLLLTEGTNSFEIRNDADQDRLAISHGTNDLRRSRGPRCLHNLRQPHYRSGEWGQSRATAPTTGAASMAVNLGAQGPQQCWKRLQPMSTKVVLSEVPSPSH